jgi:hypothetical protein
LNEALCGFDGVINETHHNQRSEKVLLGRYELIRAAQQNMTARVSPLNQISRLTQRFDRQAPFSPLKCAVPFDDLVTASSPVSRTEPSTATQGIFEIIKNMPDFKAQKIRLKIRRKRNFAAGAPCVTALTKG